jgi:hypothetical protein
LVLFGVIPAKAGIPFFKDLRIYWTPVFTGVTNEFQFFHSFKGGRGDFPRASQSKSPYFPLSKGDFNLRIYLRISSKI